MHIQDSLGLYLRQLQALHQAIPCRLRVFGRSDELNYKVKELYRLAQPLKDVRSLLGPPQQELGAAGYNHLTVLYEELKYPFEVQDLGLTINQGEHRDVE